MTKKSHHNTIRVSKEAIRANEEKLKKKPGFNQMAQKMFENLDRNVKEFWDDFEKDYPSWYEKNQERLSRLRENEKGDDANKK